MDARRALARHVGVNLVGGERDQRREHPHQRVDHVVERGLHRAALGRGGGRAIQPVARDIDIERTQVDHDEIDDRVVGGLEIVLLEGAQHVGLQALQARQDVAVELGHPASGAASRAGSKSARLPSM